MNDEWREMLIRAGFERIDNNGRDDVRQHWQRIPINGDEYDDYNGQNLDFNSQGFVAIDVISDNAYDNVARTGATTAELASALEWLDAIRNDDES